LRRDTAFSERGEENPSIKIGGGAAALRFVRGADFRGDKP
jgi:hypothetical protein